jgi:hypothetical protein
MAYNLAGMADFAKSNGTVLISDLILKGQSFNLDGIRVESGIKSADIFADFGAGTTVLQSTHGDPGALSYSGGSVLKDVKVEVVEMAIKERYAKGLLDSKIAQMQMRAGSDPSNPLPYADVLVGLKGQTVGGLNDILIWQGDNSTGNTNVNTNKFDGILTQVKAGGYVTGGTAAALTGATAIAVVEAFVKVAHAAFPAWVNAGSFLYMSPSNFATYYRAVYGLTGAIDSLNIGSAKPLDKFFVPGTNVMVLSTNGLTGKHNFLQTRDGNFFIGTDLVSEDDTLSFEYLTEGQAWRLFGAYKLGAKVARIAEVVATK